MATAATVLKSIAVLQPGLAAPPHPFGLSSVFPVAPAARIAHTLHCSSNAAGEAAQFNQSVSAMPSNLTRTFQAPAAGHGGYTL